MRKRTRVPSWSIPILILVAWTVPATAELPVVHVGVVTDGPWRYNETILALTRSEVATLTAGEFDVRFEERHYLTGDWTLEDARRNVRRLLADPEVDVVIAWGLLGSQVACCFDELPKPIIAPVVIDIDLQGLPLLTGASGVPNLSYVALPENLLTELRTLRQIAPFDRLAFLINASLHEAVPELEERTRALCDQLGIEIDFVPVSDRAEAALQAIPEAADAVYVWPLGRLGPDELRNLIDGLRQRRLPTFSALGRDEVEAGMLASLGSEEFFPKLSRRVALNLQRILLGEQAGTIPVAFSVRDRLTLNMATAREIGVSPPWDVLLEADVLHPEDLEGARRLSLASAVQEAVEVNLDLAARRLQVTAGDEDIRQALAAFLPEVQASVSALQVDRDRAEASFGSQPERSWTGGLSLQQLIYSDAAAANLEAQRRFQDSRVHGLAALRLDIALDAAIAYLNLLRAETLLQVERNNLALTRSNLELASIRRSIGAGNPAEVYRWESSIAADRNALVQAGAQVRNAAIAVNRLLHRPLGEIFVTEEVELDDAGLITAEERFSGYIETPLHFATFQDFGVEEGLAAAPELQQLLAGIEAQKRLVTAARRAYWAPNFGASLSLEERLGSSGAGADAGPLTPGGPQADDTSWSVGLSASLPLFLGGSRGAERRQVELDLERLQLEWRAASERLEQRIRSASIAARASYSGIDLSRQAADAARSNLELVADSYARGAVSILDLLDAQNAALNAEQSAANATYDFLIDLMEVQRASNQFDFFVSPEARDAWFERLDRWFEEAGVERWRPAGAPAGGE